ncbi:TlpA family protein disulfide reductase, partial [bacterium]
LHELLLLLDKDGNGTYHPGFEFNPAREPFNVGGTTYELKGEGGKLTVLKSVKTVKERFLPATPPDPNLANGLTPGKAALKFTATTMSGKSVAFPTSYRGKVVLVDFWATWCGPCMREVPNLAKVYGKYKAKGFEVLGVSLDEPDSTAKIKTVAEKNGMTWEQVYDGKGWQAAVAQQYGIKAIPATYLVDGDTGKILAISDALRGEKLDATIAKALAGKKEK